MLATQTFPSAIEGRLDPAPLSLISHAQSESTNIFAAIPRKHKKQKPISRGFYENSRLTRVHQLNLEDPMIKNIPRAGVLFYTSINDELHLCFGKDARSGDLTDFGGGRRHRESPIKCAVREGNEESRYAFGEIKPEQVQGFFCLYSSNMLIIFIPVISPNDVDIRQITDLNFKSKQFLSKKQVRSKCFNEVSEIIWLNEAQIDNLFSERPSMQMFAKVRRFIYSCVEFSQSTTIMKNILRTTIKQPPEPPRSTPIVSSEATSSWWNTSRVVERASIVRARPATQALPSFSVSRLEDAFQDIALVREDRETTDAKRIMKTVRTSC